MIGVQFRGFDNLDQTLLTTFDETGDVPGELRSCNDVHGLCSTLQLVIRRADAPIPDASSCRPAHAAAYAGPLARILVKIRGKPALPDSREHGAFRSFSQRCIPLSFHARRLGGRQNA